MHADIHARASGAAGAGSLSGSRQRGYSPFGSFSAFTTRTIAAYQKDIGHMADCEHCVIPWNIAPSGKRGRVWPERTASAGARFSGTDGYPTFPTPGTSSSLRL